MDAVPTWDQVPSLDAGNGSVAVGLKVSKHCLEINTDIQKLVSRLCLFLLTHSH